MNRSSSEHKDEPKFIPLAITLHQRQNFTLFAIELLLDRKRHQKGIVSADSKIVLFSKPICDDTSALLSVIGASDEATETIFHHEANQFITEPNHKNKICEVVFYTPTTNDRIRSGQINYILIRQSYQLLNLQSSGHESRQLKLKRYLSLGEETK